MPEQDIATKLVEALKEISNLGPRKGMHAVVRNWKDFIQREGEQFGFTLLECLACKGPRWKEEIRKAVMQRRGGIARYSRTIKAILRRASPRLLNRPGAPYELIRAHTRSKTKVNIAFESRDLGLFEIHRAISKLPDPARGPFDLEVEFQEDVIYVHGVALLAAWLVRHCAHLRYTTRSATTKRYLDHIGFSRLVSNAVALQPVQFDAENYVALTQISSEKPNQVDTLAGQIGQLFQRHMKLSDDTRRALTIVIAETVENVYKHSESKFPAYVVAQAHPKRRRIAIAIVDTGIGIYESFTRSDNPKARGYGSTPKAAVDAAVLPLVSSKKEAHFGYGLYVVRKLAELNRGTFRLTSGAYTHILLPPEWKKQRKPRPVVEHANWHGTFVGLLLNTDRSLDVEKVYKGLPIPRGYEKKDFFK